jgi:Tfp pilus assembly protein PilF
MLLMRGGEFGKAIEHLKQVVSIEPRHLAAHFNLGLIYRQSGENELARQTFQAILQHHPEHQDAARMLRELDRGR